MPPFQSFRQRLARVVGRANKAAGIAQIVRLVAGHNESMWPRLDVYDQQATEYLRSSWVYVAVTRIAEAAALVPYEVYATQAEAQIELPNHPIQQLLRAPNPFTSQFDLIESTFGYLELTGNAFWFLAGPSGGVPTEIWPLRPDRMRVVPDATQFIGGYVYTVDGVDIPLAAEEVIHFKRFHPTSDLYGLSALEAAAVASQADRAMAQWNRNFFSGDKGVPAGIVTIKNMVDDASYERIQREWRESYGGTQRKTAFLRGSDIAWSDIGLSQKDSDFLASRQFSKHEILQIFGIPAGLYEENATQANAAIARETFLGDTIWPKLIRFSQKLTQHLAPFFGDDLVLVPEDIRDNSANIAEVQAAAGYLTVNEIRQRYWGLDAVIGGDVPLSKGVTSTPDPAVSLTASREGEQANYVPLMRED